MPRDQEWLDWNVNKKRLKTLVTGATRMRGEQGRLAKAILDDFDRWRIRAGAHSGGTSPNEAQHITLQAGTTTYHLYIKYKNGKALISRITG
jgi:hypothetical protein